MKQLPDDPKAHRRWGITVDYFNMDQAYKVNKFMLGSQDEAIMDLSQIDAHNDTQQLSLKLDFWPTRYLNIFGILGRADADTIIDLDYVSSANPLKITSEGTLFGAGFTLARGGKSWFSSFNATLTESRMNGDIESSVRNLTIQPRLGLVKGKMTYWVSAIYLKTDEEHKGSVELPALGAIPVSLVLAGEYPWSAGLGVGHVFSPKAMMFIELGLGRRDHLQFSSTYRF
ncbi:MAG: hypothetical protein SH820_06925 [Xanthomonadales bacterium]|nr:hypothetical protein [Xanthomonadales bacterium]